MDEYVACAGARSKRQITTNNGGRKTMPKINKTTVETVKTVVIAVLVTAVIAFVAGMRYQTSLNQKADAQVQSAVQTLKNQ
jgi:Mn2+/Fe2+ NRAMP family transporter